MVPELLVTDINKSLAFWRDVLGFDVAFHRLEKGFAYLDRNGVQVMLDQRNDNWETGEMEQPFGRGINLQMTVPAIAPLLEALEKAQWPLYQGPYEKWRHTGDVQSGCREFLVQDPDGYLLRFYEDLGCRPLS